MRRYVLAALAALALAGCGAVPDASAPAGPAPAPAAPVLAVIEPAEVEIPSIGAAGPLIPLGRDAGGGWAEPDVNSPGIASWYSDGIVPGEVGPAVILGHVNGPLAGVAGGQPGVFDRLGEVEVGDDVLVHGVDGEVITFVVVGVEQQPKTEFDSAAILAPTPGRTLTLITCGGDFDRGVRSYRDNVLVHAVRA